MIPRPDGPCNVLKLSTVVALAPSQFSTTTWNPIRNKHANAISKELGDETAISSSSSSFFIGLLPASSHIPALRR